MPRIVIGLLLLALTFAGIPVFAETLTGRVVGVADGDTLTSNKSDFGWWGLTPRARSTVRAKG